MADFYAILGLSHTAEADDIAKAYRRAALTYNPECNLEHADPMELARRFKLVSQAYVVLSDPKIRAVYDVYGEFGVLNGGTGKGSIKGGVALDDIDPGVVFRRFFGVDNPFQVLGDISGIKNNQHQFFSNSAAIDKQPPKAEAIVVRLDVTLEDIFHGSSRTVHWTHEGVSKSHELFVPKGAADGTVLILHGKGAAPAGLSPGDIHVKLSTSKHEKFTRHGDDLHVLVPIALVDALCGVTVSASTIGNRELQVLIDEIVHPKFQKRITGEGMPRVSNPSERGDLVIECDIQFPKYLSAEQKSETKRILTL